jgi:hypothetical protein
VGSQLFLTLLCVYTIIITYTLVTKVTYNILTRLHWLTSQLSITFTNYRRLYISTLPVSVSYRDLTRRTDLPKTNSCYFSNWAYVAFAPIHRKPVNVVLTVADQRTIDISPTVAGVTQWRDCLLRCLGDACDITAATRRRPRLPSPLHGVYSVTSWLADGCLATRNNIRNPIVVQLVFSRGVCCLAIHATICWDYSLYSGGLGMLIVVECPYINILHDRCHRLYVLLPLILLPVQYTVDSS